MHPQVLVHEQGVQGFGIESCQEDVDHDYHVDLTVLETHGEIFVVVLELLGTGVVTGPR